jgi:hypothetical protein
MPNTILTPDIIAREALMVLRNNAVMANLVHRNYSSDFVAAVGDTITIRKPATFVANEYDGSKITVQDATETGVEVKMDKHLDVSFAVTSKQMTMDIADFSAQLLVPAMQAFADKIDKYLIGLEAEATSRHPHADGAIAPADMIAARKFLTQNAAPLADRRFIVGATAEADLLSNELFVSAEKVGDSGTALREASMGRKFGFDCYVDQNIAKTGNYVPSIAFHKNAMALVTRPLALPQGAAKAAIMNYDGFGLRVVYGYDMNTKTDTISIDMLCGVKLLDDNLIAVVSDSRA